MRSAISLVLLLTAAMTPAYAEEATDDVNAYCNEQAQLAGIEDAEELSQYVQECIDSYATPAGE